jgi:hypothetical protein
MLLPKILVLFISFLSGIVVNHWIARRFFSATSDFKEKEILLHGLLVSIIINGTIGTYLAILKIFNLYSFALIFIFLLYLLRSDLHATLVTMSEECRNWFYSICKLNVLTIATTCLVCAFTVALVALCFLPNQNPDGWVFHLPIAKSIVKNSGFIYPIIEDLNYSSQPSFVSVLFAEALLLYPHFAIASVVNVLIYLFTLVALAAVWKNSRLALCLLLVIVGLNFNLITSVPTVLTDMTRTCFSVLGLTYIVLFHARRVPYYAGLAAICIGAAVAAKYTELITLSLMGLVLLPSLRSADGRRLILNCSVIVIIIAIFWYLKNWILLNNPIYPFLFGHPGISDDWMKWYLTEMTQAFDPSHRHFVRNLFKSQGWIDSLSVIWTWFFQESLIAKLCFILGLLGAVTFRRLIAPMFAVAVFLFMYWYVVLFNHVRWAKPAIMLLLVTGCFVLLNSLENSSFEKKQRIKNLISNFYKKYKILASTIVALLFLALIFFVNSTVPSLANATTKWTFLRAAEPVLAVFTPGGVDRYLSKTREGYAIIRYVSKNNLYRVFQPFQTGISAYANVYNEGITGTWFVDINDVPAVETNCAKFIQKYDINYYVTRPPLSKLDEGRIDPQKLKVAFQIMDCLKTNAELVFEDLNGWKLYKTGP